jgi:acetylglutamate kinase
VLPDLLRLLQEGAQLVIIHGGGKAINQLLTKLGETPQFKNGQRVTDPAALAAALMAARGQINPALVAEFNRAVTMQEWPSKAPKAIGLTGIDGDLVVAQREIRHGDIGLVGQIMQINLEPLLMALEWGYVPIVAPFGTSKELQPEGGRILNINADSVAAHIAAAIEADFCVFLTDVPGILDAAKQTIVRLDPFSATDLMREEVITGGMIPKVQAAITALKGSKFVAIVDGNQPGALYNAVTAYQVAGTLLINHDELSLQLADFQPDSVPRPEFPYTIEPAPLDIPTLGAFLRRAFENTPDFAFENSLPGSFEGIVTNIQTGAWGTYQQAASLVALDGNSIVGAILVVLPDRFNGAALLAEIATDPAYRDKAIARTLLERSLALLQEAGVPTLRLNVTRGNAPAYHLYRSMGFEPTVVFDYDQ